MFDEPTFSQTAEAVAFVQQISTKTGRKALLGNPDKYQPDPYNYVALGHTAVEDGLEKVRALAKDRTRNLVQKHDAAGAVAQWTCERLEQARAGIEGTIRKLNNQIEDAILKTFDLDKVNDRVYDRICNWIERTYREEGGAAKIRATVDGDAEVATVVFFTNHSCSAFQTSFTT